MRRALLACIGLLLATPAYADMFPDAGNAKLPEAQDNLGIARSVEAYGAKCDGTTDDTAAIQAAIDANQTSVAGATVKALTIPAGTCITGTLTISGQINLSGQGAQAGSRLALKGLSATPLIVVQTAGTYSTSGDPRITIRDLQLLAAGNTHSGPGVGTSHGIDLRAGSYRISVELNHVAIWNFGGSGINHSGGWLGAMLILNAQFFSNQYGVTNTSGPDWSFNNVQIYNNVIDGISYSGSGYAFFDSVGVYTNGRHGIAMFGNTASNVWLGGSIDRNGGNGIFYNNVSQPWLFVGPQFVFNNASNGGYSDIQVEGAGSTGAITLVSPNMQSTFAGADYNIKYTNGATAPVVITGSAAGITPGVEHANFTNQRSSIQLPAAGWLSLGTRTGSGSGTMDWINLITPVFGSYQLSCSNLVPVDNSVAILLRFGQGTTPTWLSSGYQWGRRFNTSAPTSGDQGNAADSGIGLAASVPNTAANGGVSGDVVLAGLSDGATVKTVNFAVRNYNGTNIVSIAGVGSYAANTNPMTSLRLITQGGAGASIASGSCTLYGRK